MGKRAVSILNKERLQGVPATSVLKLKKLSKTQRKPSVQFAGKLSGRERKLVFEEAAKVAVGQKKIEEVGVCMRRFVALALKRGEKS